MSLYSESEIFKLLISIVGVFIIAISSFVFKSLNKLENKIDSIEEKFFTLYGEHKSKMCEKETKK